MGNRAGIELVDYEDIVITIPLKTLHHALYINEELSDEEGRPLFKITDELAFMKDFFYELQSEDGSGSNKLDYLLDDILVQAIENGAEGVEEIVYTEEEDEE